ncbi:hypothetical protein IMW82_07040 [Rhodanobacter sp. B2A1Ga4]|uniref:terminase n=1 Tax=Rhodanobacter TaxID=75309 RepID=UPI000D37E4D7|nr:MULTISPECIES: terminase [Rhodanobacter]MBQ4854423.1 hypothetical protein [Rhodanobacter sp. B2A1Ga4]
MPRQRKATNVLELSGAFAKNPNRRRVDPVPHGPIGKAPKQGLITFAKAWAMIVAQCPDGVLADRDRVWVEVASSLFVQFRADPANMHPAKLSRLTAMLSSLGMSPADASRVVAKPVEKANPFAE